jgi:hypothetical protein
MELASALLAPLWTVETAIAVAVVAIAGVLRGFSGFGSAMILAPSLAALYPVKVAVPLIILLEVALSFQLLPAAVKQVVWREIGLLTLAALPGLVVGVLLLEVMPEATLRLAISGAIILFLCLLLANVRRRGPVTDAGLLATGALSGVANGASGVGGPPVVLYYLAGDGSAAALRATVICYFFALDVVSAGIFAARGLLTVQVVGLTVVSVPAAVLGVWLGSRWFAQASEATYRRVAYGLIAAVALIGPFV